MIRLCIVDKPKTEHGLQKEKDRFSDRDLFFIHFGKNRISASVYRNLLFLLFFYFTLCGCGQEVPVRQLKAPDFNTLLKTPDASLLDVRTLSEYKNGHIKNAGQLNYYALDFRKKLLMLPKDHPIFLYCNTGYRSQRAARILAKNGYQQVYNLEHGVMEWNVYNLPLVVEPDARPDREHSYDFDDYQKLIQSDSLVFIDFYAPWCGPCRKMMPMMDSLKTEYHQRIKMVKVNADASQKLMKQLEITGVPYLVLYRKGALLFSKNGLIKKSELVQLFEDEIKKQEAGFNQPDE